MKVVINVAYTLLLFGFKEFKYNSSCSLRTFTENYDSGITWERFLLLSRNTRKSKNTQLTNGIVNGRKWTVIPDSVTTWNTCAESNKCYGSDGIF